MGEVTREQIIETARHLADENGTSTLSRSEFERQSAISQYFIYKLFPEGRWLEVVSLAGLDHDPGYHSPCPMKMSWPSSTAWPQLLARFRHGPSLSRMHMSQGRL